MGDALEPARALLPDARLEDAGQLRGGERSEVRRATVRRDGTPDSSVIVKQFRSAGEGWAREVAALSVLPAHAPGPRLIASAPEPPVVIMSDMGWGASVADALLGADADHAAAAVERWAGAIGALHRSTLGLRDAFADALAEHAGELPIADEVLPIGLDDAARALADQAADLGVPVTSAALEELRGLGRRLGGDGPAAISPADACPDNNIGVGEQLVLVDFEAAQWRHVAWDVAYLRVPWPSCWCSWRMPGGIADRAVARYREVLADALPYVLTLDFERDVAAAATGWAFISTTWFLHKALADDPPAPDPDKPTPTRRAMILHRLSGAARSEQLAALAELATRLRAALVERWGEVPLAVAPAFADRVRDAGQ